MPSKRTIVIIALIILALIILVKLKNRMPLWLKGLKSPSGEGINDKVSDERKSKIDEIARSINAYLDQGLLQYSLGVAWSTSPLSLLTPDEYEAYFQAAKELPNNEFYYLTRSYKKSYMKSMYKDIDEETFYNNWDEPLLQRMQEMNLVN